MPFTIVRNDIVNMTVDAIVNAANPEPIIGYGCDAGIHKKAGPKLLKARKRIGAIDVGDAAITPAFDLDARYVIHAVGPVWEDGTKGEEALLCRCYDQALMLALQKHCKSVAFPLLSAGNHGFPKPLALQAAIRAFSKFLTEYEMQIYLVVFGKDSFKLSEQLVHSVESYIDEHYVREKILDEYEMESVRELGDEELCQLMKHRRDHERFWLKKQSDSEFMVEACTASMSMVPSALPSLDDMLNRLDAGFSETLLKLIDHSGKTDAEVYKKANIDRKLFSKIRSNPHYKPSKNTALAFAVALELDLEETKDFLGRAGYALSHSSVADLVVEYFIRNKNYDMFTLNEVLFHYDQPTLGG